MEFDVFKRRGFTLIALTITVLITGIVAAVAAPKFANSIIRYKIDAAAMRIAGDYVVDLSDTGYAATLVSVSFGSGGTDNSITYDMYGRPDYGGFVVIQFGSEQRTITVNATTGKTTVT